MADASLLSLCASLTLRVCHPIILPKPSVSSGKGLKNLLPKGIFQSFPLLCCRGGNGMGARAPVNSYSLIVIKTAA
ncbi:hypothetical protein SCARR_02971 [Pontiella sulfatireligans]|uniref:Uncharacterized protein n=1 Tax=Pontiella sulfatireligans TaxID=2750658 RepID=A0A6C2UNK7_9BACT|nr:hypothetical protein SCARR_02971 [Pontiella sulfatireligans]